MSTLQAVELGVLGPLQVRQDGAPALIPGGKPSAILTMLGLHSGSVVSAETLLELLWGDDSPRTAAKALQTHISALRRALGDGFVLTQGSGWTLAESEVDASRYKSAARAGRDAAAAGDTTQAVTAFEEALTLWRGTPELPDTRRGTSEKTRWIEGHAALVEDRADALLARGRAAEIVGELEAAVAEAPLRERRWGQLMLALYRAGRQGEALAAYQRARALLAEELGVDPGPDLRRLESAIVGQDTALEIPAAQDLPSVTRTVTFLLTDIEGSTAAWEADASAMAVALARHDELVEQIVTSRGGRLIKTRGEGDATFSVFERASAAAAAAIELQDAIFHEPWALREPMRIRVALHTGEVELRDGDYFGRAVNRAARLRSLAIGGQILCSGAIVELVVDSLPDDVVLADLGMRQLKNLARPEHVFELRLETAEPPEGENDAPIERPGLPAVLTGPGPFVGRGRELEGLVSAWQTALAGGTHAVLIAGEPGVGKTRLAGEWSQQAYQQGAVVLYGRCDEDLGAPYQPFAEALRSLVPCVGVKRLRGMRGAEALLPLVPGLTEVLPDLAAPTRADPDTERYALFDAVVALLEIASTSASVVLILDDLHWAAKPTLLLLRHLLRFGDRARVQIVGTYRSTDLDRSHPLAATLADLHRDGTANRIQLSGLDEDDVTAYVAEAGYDDEELARALASVTGGNPFFLIEALRHVDESGGRWDPSTLPQGVREAVSRRLSRLPEETNSALAAAAVFGSRFSVELVERVVEDDLVDAFDAARKAGIVIEEPGGRYRFNHALVRQSLLAELPSVRRMRLHQRIAATLENEPGADDELLAELAHHYFECAWAGNAAKAVEYCRRAADQAVARLAYEGAADLYGQALHALDELDDELPDRDDQAANLLIARCEALLAAGDVASAAGAVSQLQRVTVNSARLAAWATCFDGQLSMLVHPERLDEVETALASAAQKLAELDDAAGEANAHTVRAACLARLGRIGDCEIALDDALTAARRARDHRRVNAVLAGAPLAALWGPNPVPRAGGRCLDVVRLLRITTDSPAVEATSTRCQAVLEAFRGRAEAARRMIDSARRTVTEFGLRHALLEVEQFAGIVELVADDPAAAEPHLRQAYNGFRRMGLDADAAETAALLGRACLALDRDAEADELCTESERLAGHALKASGAWRTLRARLLSKQGDHGEAQRVAEAAVGLAERTDALVDHGDACLSLATVLGAAGDVMGARAAAERAVDLYERKGSAALAEKARHILGERPAPVTLPEAPSVEQTNACVQAGSRLIDAVNREAWDEVKHLLAPYVSVESRRKIVGFPRIDLASRQWPQDMRRYLETGMVRYRHTAIAVRGERLALTRLEIGTSDLSSGAPQDEFLHLAGLDEEGRISLQLWFDVEDMDAALAELDAAHARFEKEQPTAPRIENAASQAVARYFANFAARDWDAFANVLADDISTDDRRRVANAGIRHGRDAEIANQRAIADIGQGMYQTFVVIAARGERLILARVSSGEPGPERFLTDVLSVVETNSQNQIAAIVVFDLDDLEAAIAELDARYLAGEGAAHANTWLALAGAYAALNRHEIPAAPDWVNVDHRRATTVAPNDMAASIRATWDVAPNIIRSIEAVHRLDDLGAVITHKAYGTSQEGFDAEWRLVALLTFTGELISRAELFDESDLDAALARFEQLRRPTRQLENAASQASERYMAHFAARDWGELEKVLADDVSVDDRRRVVNAGTKHGRDAEIANLRTAADVGIANLTSDVIATRGQRLILARVSGGQGGSVEFRNEVLGIIETNSQNQISAIVVFDLDDFDAAIAELESRYLAGEAGPNGQTWSAITRIFASINRRELPATTRDCVNIDHRRATAVAPGDAVAYILESWDGSTGGMHIETVHRLNNLGAVATYVGYGTSREGFEAEWRGIYVLTVDGDLVDHWELFEEADLDVALARFDELSRPAPRLENAASQAAERYLARYAARDWDALAKILADDIVTDDRRRVVNAGIRHGRDAEIASLRAYADAGITHMTFVVIAARGERLILARASGAGGYSGEFRNELLGVVELNSDNQISAMVVFDLDDFEAAIAELDARYLAGEAAAYSQTWSVFAYACAAVNRHELPPTTPDWVNVDHRRVTAFAPGDMSPYIRATWDIAPDIKIYIEAVHRLSNLGAVVTQKGRGTSKEGFEAEWREISLGTVEGGRFNRTELFDGADLDAALARFEQLSRPAPRLENAASQAADRYLAHFAARDWEALAKLLANDISTDDRRRTVNAGIRHGRDAEMASLRAYADVGVMYMGSVAVAARGERLILVQASGAGGESRDDLLAVVEINSDNQISALVVFDVDDFESAFEELEARYLAGEAAAHARTWSVVARSYATMNRHEDPPKALEFTGIDHRRGTAFAPGEHAAYVHAAWDQIPDLSYRVEAVHRLTDLGVVVTHTKCGTSQEGFEAEWREIHLLTVEGGLFNRSELFDEIDVDAVLARFDELSQPTPRLANTATRVSERLYAYVAVGDWHAVTQISAENVCVDDRRRVVNAGVLHGRDANIKDAKATVDVGFTMTMLDVLATRGGRLAITGVRVSGPDPEAIQNDDLQIVEIDAEEKIAGVVVFDLDNFEAAIAELDARYLAGEAAAHAHTWSVITSSYAAFNRHEVPETDDWVTIDHRRGTPFEPSDMTPSIRTIWDLTPDLSIHIEAVHRLNNSGAVITHHGHGSSQEGFDAEWRAIDLLMVDGDRINRCEVFDDTDLDAAVAKFEELSRPTPKLENAASQVDKRFQACFAARDWDAMAAMLSEGFSVDDRRRVVNAGSLQGRDAELIVHAYADLGSENVTATVVAIRGQRLVLSRYRFSDRDPQPDTFRIEMLVVVEIDADERMAAAIVFDADDFNGAIAELDARYLAGDAAAHARTWSAIMQVYDALNRHEMPATTPDWAAIDHRRGIAFAPSDANAYILARQDPQGSVYVETVTRLSNLGAVFTWAGRATSHEGFDAEWRGVNVVTVEGDLINRGEIFDEADLDAALARFEELHPHEPRPENAASHITERFLAHFAAGDWDSVSEMVAEDFLNDDRRRVVGSGVRHGRDAEIADLRAIAGVWLTSLTSTVMATRGQRLVLRRVSASDRDRRPDVFLTDTLCALEVDGEGRVVAAVSFDLDDIDAAVAELDARYLAGEAAAHAHTWSVIMAADAALNRRELPPTTPDWVNIDHRRGTSFASGEMPALLDAVWNLTTDLTNFIEAVHRLDDLGAVVTSAAHETSGEGFDAEWRVVSVVTLEGDRINRLEVFDEAELDAAIARFEELHPHTPRPKNAASQVIERYQACFTARDWAAFAELVADDIVADDRRRVVNAGVRPGRDAHIADMRATVEVSAPTFSSSIIATRGERLALAHVLIFNRGMTGEVGAETLGIVEIDADERIVALVTFDLDDINAAFAELDARYLAGEAATYAHTWSIITGGYAAFNRREVPLTTQDWVSIDHRRAIACAPGELSPYMQATWDMAPDVYTYAESAHRLSNLGAVVRQVSRGTSQQGFDGEWREIVVVTVEGNLINRIEIFDEADLDTALARFGELERQTPSLENAATRVWARATDAVNRRDVDGLLALASSDHRFEDRRKGLRDVFEGPLQGREAVRALFETIPSSWWLEVEPIAIRGSHLSLTRACYRDTNDADRPIAVELLQITEVDDDLVRAFVNFDPDDIDGAFAELTARWIASGEVAYPAVIEAVDRIYATINRHDWDALATCFAGAAYVNHRQLAYAGNGTIGDWPLSMQTAASLAPDLWVELAEVLSRSAIGIVGRSALKGTSTDGAAIEIPFIVLILVDGERVTRLEAFDEGQRDMAVARLQELNRPV